MNKHIFSGSAVKQIDQLAIREFGYDGFELMRKAGESAFKRIRQLTTSKTPTAETGSPKMLLLCGTGNNGGDGYVVARLALQAGWRVLVLASGEPKTVDALSAAKQFSAAGGSLVTLDDLADEQGFTVVVDALLGIGLRGAPRQPYSSLIGFANSLTTKPAIANAEEGETTAKILRVALDAPSGVSADTGEVFEPAFTADLTITYIAPKLGLLTGPALNHVGNVVLETLGLEKEILSKVEHSATLLEPPVLSSRQADTHKGSYGHIFVVGGDNGMLGAVLLAGSAALRCGSGKVQIVSTEQHLDQAALHSPELMSLVFDASNSELFDQADALALGPGLGLNVWGRQVFERLIDLDAPMVIDADALSMLAQRQIDSTTNTRNWVLTPHPGEAARLLGCSTREVQSNRLAAVTTIAEKYKCVCVLKGAGSLIADSTGDVTLCDLGNAGMATAGMGDVLSGMIAAFLGQGMSPLRAAQACVWLHAYTADLLVENSAQAALIASDIVASLPLALQQFER